MTDDPDVLCVCGHDAVDHEWWYPEWTMCRLDPCACGEFVAEGTLEIANPGG